MVQEKTPAKLSAKNIWGKVTIYLREHNNMILHIICGDIMDVEDENGVFVINTNNYTFNILQEKRNYDELQKALEFFGYKKFEIRIKQKALTKEENLAILNKFFDNQVNVIE